MRGCGVRMWTQATHLLKTEAAKFHIPSVISCLLAHNLVNFKIRKI